VRRQEGGQLVLGEPNLASHVMAGQLLCLDQAADGFVADAEKIHDVGDAEHGGHAAGPGRHR